MRNAASWASALLLLAACAENDTYQPLNIAPVFDRAELVVNEGQSVDVTVTLSKPVFAGYTMNVAVANQEVVRVEPNTLSFGPGRSTAQLRVSAAFDTNDLNEETTITVGAGFATKTLPVRVIDKEGVHLNIIQEPAKTDFMEGDNLSYMVSLTEAPSRDIRVAVTIPMQDAPFGIQGGHYTVEPTDWKAEHTVHLRGREDHDLTEDEVIVEFRLNDELYAQKKLKVADRSEQQWQASPAAVLLPEGRSLFVAVRPLKEPTTPVTLKATAADPGRLVVDPKPLVFDAENYVKPQRLKLTASTDVDTEKNIVNLTLSGGGAKLVVPVEITDPDQVDVLPTPATQTINEGEGGSFTVQLSHQPTEAVTVTVSPENAQAATISAGGSLSFTTENWNQPQTVNFSSNADFDTRSTEVRFLMKAPGLQTGVFTLTLRDSDSQGVVVSPAQAEVWETGADNTATVNVHLAQAPSGSFTVAASSGTPGKMSVEPATLTFNGSNWNQDQTVTVRGRPDPDAGDDTVFLLLRQQGTGPYAGVPVKVRDRTQQQIVLASDRCLRTTDTPNTTDFNHNRDPGTVNTYSQCVIVEEEGPAAVVRVRLGLAIGDGEATVSVAPAAGHLGQLYADPPKLTFNGANYNQYQEVRLYALGDRDNLHPDVFNVEFRDGRQPEATATLPVVIYDDDEHTPGSANWLPQNAARDNFEPRGNTEYRMMMVANRFVRKGMAWNSPYVAFLVRDYRDRPDGEIHLVFTTRSRDWYEGGRLDGTQRQWVTVGQRPDASHPNSATVLPVRDSDFAVLVNVHGNTHYHEYQRPAAGPPTGVANSGRNFGDSIGNAMARSDAFTGLGFVRPNGAVEFRRMRNADRSDAGAVETLGQGATWIGVEYMSHSDQFMILYGDANGHMHCALRGSDGAAVGETTNFELPTDGLATTYDWERRRVVAVYAHDDSDAEQEDLVFAVAFGADCSMGTPVWLKRTSAETDTDATLDPPQITFNGVEFGVSTVVAAPPVDEGNPVESGYTARIMRVNQEFGVKDEFAFGAHWARHPAMAWAGDRWFMQYKVDWAEPIGAMRLAMGSLKIQIRDGQHNGVERGVDCTGTYCTSPTFLKSQSWSDRDGDDLEASAIDTFVREVANKTKSTSQTGVGTRADDWMFIEITDGSGGGGAVCVKNAGWYTEQLKNFGVSGKTATEPYPWPHYYRPEGGDWSSMSTSPLENLFGDACGGMFSWCLPQISGGRKLSLLPGNTGADECAVDGASSGTRRRLTISIGPNIEACGIDTGD